MQSVDISINEPEHNRLVLRLSINTDYLSFGALFSVLQHEMLKTPRINVILQGEHEILYVHKHNVI